MKTTIIEILNKIANGEEVPKKILYKDEIFEYNNNDYESIHSSVSLLNYFGDDYIRAELLDEVEILETTITMNKQDKIEKIDMFDYFTGYWYKELSKDFLEHLENNFETLNSKINEIIDKVNRDD